MPALNLNEPPEPERDSINLDYRILSLSTRDRTPGSTGTRVNRYQDPDSIRSKEIANAENRAPKSFRRTAQSLLRSPHRHASFTGAIKGVRPGPKAPRHRRGSSAARSEP